MIGANMFGSGKIAALIEMRDHVLVDAQAQLDQIASAMSRALSDRTTDGTAVTSGSQSGFDVDIGALQSGNTINLTYTDNLTNTQRTVTLVRVDDPSVLPLPDDRDAESERQGHRHRFLRRAWPRRSRRSTRRSARPACISPIRPAPRCACSTTARAGRSPSTRCPRPRP